MIASPLAAQTTQRVSIRFDGTQTSQATMYPVLSADGRFVAFRSFDNVLVPDDVNQNVDVFVRDREAGTTEIASLSSTGDLLNGESGSFLGGFSMSADGRYVAFMSKATNAVPGDSNGFTDVFVRDRQLGTTVLVSVGMGGGAGNQDSEDPHISADGRYVAFTSLASDLVPVDTNHDEDVFVRDLQAGTMERVSISNTESEANRGSLEPSISANGRFVAFTSNSTNLVSITVNGLFNIYVRDRQDATTEIVSLSNSGMVANNVCGVASISGDGRFVAFRSDASNLWPVPSTHRQIFVRDRQTATLDQASLTTGEQIADFECYRPAISTDGRYVVFKTSSTNLVPGDTNGAEDAFLRDLVARTTVRVDLAHDGAQANAGGSDPAISADGGYVAFSSTSSNLVPGDTNAAIDVFVRDLKGGPSFTSACDPNVSGVIACPCGNPPSGAGRGCDNSAATGGASLAAAGGAFLSSDTLVFTTSGEKPTATSVLLQGTTLAATGVVYGQGVRCVGGTLKRLFTKTASGGSVKAPNFAAGDPSVSSRSAAKGNVIAAGETRTYLVFYRDPIVLGGCPSGSTFNATQTGVVAWSP